MRAATRNGLVLLVAAATTLGGCARTIVDETQETDYDPNDLTAQLDFWHELPGRSAVSNDEGLHGVLLFFDGEDTTGSYAQRVRALQDRGWLDEGFDEPADMAMQRGRLAAVLCRAMDIEGGVMMQLTGGIPRYAYKELVFLGVMPDGSAQMVVDGLDYVGVISRAQDFLVVRGLEAQDVRDAGEVEAERRRDTGEEEPRQPAPPERDAQQAPR